MIELNLESIQIPAHLLCNLGQVTQPLSLGLPIYKLCQ